jgi:hypothetical protein
MEELPVPTKKRPGLKAKVFMPKKEIPVPNKDRPVPIANPRVQTRAV